MLASNISGQYADSNFNCPLYTYNGFVRIMNQPVTIRPATEQDVSRIREIYNVEVESSPFLFTDQPLTDEQQLDWLRARLPTHPVLVAAEGDYVTGWASLSPWSWHGGYDKTVEVSFFVDWAYRGRGTGKVLLQAIIDAGRDKGYRVFISRIVEGNDASITLHHNAGFQHIGTQPKVGHKLGAWHDVLLYQKNLPE